MHLGLDQYLYFTRLYEGDIRYILGVDEHEYMFHYIKYVDYTGIGMRHKA